MALETTKDLFYLILALAVGGVGVFLCWALYEMARLLHQGNQMVTETREKLLNVEKAVMRIKERIESSVSYLGVLAKSGTSIMSFFKNREERREKKRAKKTATEPDLDEEEDEDEEVES
ncbi:MAG: hypothetical protein WC641_01450 [Patescibacteria group bacterium]